MTLAKPTFPSIYKLSPSSRAFAWQKHFIDEKNKILILQRRAEQFQSKVSAEAVKRKFGGKIETDFKIFPTKEMTKVGFYICEISTALLYIVNRHSMRLSQSILDLFKYPKNSYLLKKNQELSTWK